MIGFESQPGSTGSREHQLDSLRAARDDLATLRHDVDVILDALDEDTVDDLRPRLTELIHRLLDATRVVTNACSDLPVELDDAQRTLSSRLLDFRRAIGSRSTDTIRQSLRGDLVASASAWNGLLEDVMDHLRSTKKDT
ncbi:MAG: hypothetical protein MK116_10790 [Phycisphaerales bacterium]|nr:hypothetical protein [Phycisphaerales bacterium]